MARAARSRNSADTALLVFCAVLAFVVSVLPVNVREAIAGGLRKTVVAPLVTLQTQAEKGRSAFLSREATTSKVDSLSVRTMQLASLEQENTRLRGLLGLARQLQWGFIPAEALHTRGLGDESSINLTAGSRAGVKPFSPVVAPAGLVGMIKTVESETSLAITWSNSDFRVSAMSVDPQTPAVGIVSAYTGAEARGRGALDPRGYLMELRGVAFRQTLKPGTLIVSSGLGGVFPRGIPIGTVLSEVRTTEAWTRSYLLRPAVFPPDVATVMILDPERAASEMQTVWTSAASADSAAKRIAAAGDSLARLGAAAAAEARRRTLDSLGRRGQPVDSATGLPEATPVRPPRTDSVRRDTTTRAPRADTARRNVPAATPKPRTPFDPFKIDTSRRPRRDSTGTPR